MTNTTDIEWTHWPNTIGRTWNPTRGCSRVSPGCGGAKGVGGCYAERQAYRFSQPTKRTPHPPYEGLVKLTKQGPRWTGRVDLVSDKLSDPLGWRGRSTVFVNSMSDLFHESVSSADIAAVFGVMAACPQHTFIILTKRAARMRQWFMEAAQHRAGPAWWVGNEADGALVKTDPDRYAVAGSGVPLGGPWPLPNVVLGVSVENQEWAEKRIPELRATPAACRMVSYEPALGPIDFTKIAIANGWSVNALGKGQYTAGAAGTHMLGSAHPAIDWLVLGGESGPGSRHFDIGWARSSVEACRAGGVPVFVKQLGAKPVFDVHATALHRTHEGRRQIGLTATRLGLRARKGGDMSEWPDDLRVRELPAIARRHEQASVAMTVAHGAGADGNGSFSMVALQASGSPELIGATIDLAMNAASSLRGERR